MESAQSHAVAAVRRALHRCHRSLIRNCRRRQPSLIQTRYPVRRHTSPSNPLMPRTRRRNHQAVLAVLHHHICSKPNHRGSSMNSNNHQAHRCQQPPHLSLFHRPRRLNQAAPMPTSPVTKQLLCHTQVATSAPPLLASSFVDPFTAGVNPLLSYRRRCNSISAQHDAGASPSSPLQLSAALILSIQILHRRREAHTAQSLSP